MVLAAVPVEVAGGASGLFGTAQQLGGALGVALLGTVFFGYLNGHSFEAAIVHTAPYAMGAFALCARPVDAAAAHGGVGAGADAVAAQDLTTWRARPSTKVSISSSKRSSRSARANSSARAVMYGNWLGGSAAK